MDGLAVHSTATVITRNQQLPWLKLEAIFSAGMLRSLGMVRLYNNIVLKFSLLQDIGLHART